MAVNKKRQTVKSASIENFDKTNIKNKILFDKLQDKKGEQISIVKTKDDFILNKENKNDIKLIDNLMALKANVDKVNKTQKKVSFFKQILRNFFRGGSKSTQVRSEVAFDRTFVIDRSSIPATNSDQFKYGQNQNVISALNESAKPKRNEHDGFDIKFESAPELNNVDPEIQPASNSKGEDHQVGLSNEDSVETSNEQSELKAVRPEDQPSSRVQQLVAFHEDEIKSTSESGSSSSMSPS